MYEKPSASNKVFLIRQLVNTKMKEGASVADHLVSTVTAVSGSTGSTKLKFDNIHDLILGKDIRRKTSGKYSNSLLSAEDKDKGRKQERGQNKRLVPGGFGDHGMKGIILAAKSWDGKGANSTEFDEHAPNPVVIFMLEEYDLKAKWNMLHEMSKRKSVLFTKKCITLLNLWMTVIDIVMSLYIAVGMLELDWESNGHFCWKVKPSSDGWLAKVIIISFEGASGNFPGCTDLAYKKAVSDGVDIN
ncbi:retrovirus-related pol polyprotein from transposon TNT 1-94 [Tanacetum coccineum]